MNATPPLPDPKIYREALFWRVASTTLVVITVGLFVAYLVATIWFRSLPFPGFMLTYTNTVNAALPTSDTPWMGLKAGLRHEDWIVALDGQRLSDNPQDFARARQAYFDRLGQHQPGDTLQIDFLRDTRLAPADPYLCGNVLNGIATCSVTVTLGTLPDSDLLAFFALPYIAGIFVILIGISIVRLRGDRREGFLAASLTLLGSVAMTGLFDVGSSRLLTPVWMLTASILGGALITFGLTFPLRARFVIRYPILAYAPIALCLAAGLMALSIYYLPANAWDNDASQTSTILLLIGLVALQGLQFFSQRPRALSQLARDQNYAVLIGTSIMLIPAITWLIGRLTLTRLGYNLGIPAEMLLPLYIFPAAAVAYAVLQYRRFDTDQIISQSITYVIMVGALVLSIFLLSLGSSLLARELLNINDPFLITAIIFIMVLFFTPFRTQIQQRIDAIYYRARRNYQQKVEQFSQKLINLSDYDAIRSAYQQALDATIMPVNIFVFIARRPNDDYVEYNQRTDVKFTAESTALRLLATTTEPINLQPGQPWPQLLWAEQARLNILRAAVLAPLPGTDHLNGFVVIGPSRSGKSYTFEEMRFITNLTSQFAIATERAQVIDSLERRVRELDVLSQVGQAVNFTIEFDDLLELISNQTAKLIDARCFYIVLYEEAIQQLNFAFFLEEDERYSVKEGRRWPLDDGLFSEVVRTGKALRVANYALEMRVRNAPIRFETPDLRAWMGVPLTAGRRRMGVIAVAKVNTDEPYNDDMFKIFNDIGSLAATSIDKAALFNETKARERQLTVLNDITHQLVATETDVEKLLRLIMSSAVEILNAEAGSLLLTTEDSSGDLEFRVVIGGAGEELIGKRMKAKEGIVGQVASSGKPYISNDAARDPQHSQSPSGDYQAQSLLAVPLIAKNTIVGVLEVLNKRDRTPFTQADSDLLTTFSGQAAVAIENARLLRMTDIQLSQRVKELETLERLDSELNRTLELSEVAAITVRSTMSILNAHAGALGIVNLPERVLDIVALQGYTPETYPASADGQRWPLDKGIVRRVMRTRSADLASDVSIDPDYDGQMPGSLSQMTLPMFSGSTINAILILEKTEPPRFGLSDWAFAQRIAEHASIAIANAQLYDALKLKDHTKSEFMGFAAHELKNPLTPIKTGADMVRKGILGELPEPLTNIINMVYHNSTLMERIINDLRDAARMDANQFRLDYPLKALNMREIIDAAVQPYLRKIEDVEQHFVNDISDELAPVLGDEQRLIQVFGNLISNANKYSDPEKTIRVVGKVVKNHIDQNGTRFGPMVCISVIDEGFGMKPEDIARLGRDSYFRSTNEQALAKEGTGLGMKLTFGIIASHNGAVAVESEIKKGTTFNIFLPLAPEDQNGAAARPELAAEPASD